MYLKFGSDNWLTMINDSLNYDVDHKNHYAVALFLQLYTVISLALNFYIHKLIYRR